MKAGPRNRLITVQRATYTENDYGEKVATWSDLVADEWAQVVFGTGAERREAAQRGENLSAIFRTLWTDTLATVTVEDRVAFNGYAWNVHSVVPLGFNEGIEIGATTDLDPDGLAAGP